MSSYKQKIFFRDNHSRTSDTNSYLHAKLPISERGLIFVLQKFFASIHKIFIFAGRLGTRLLFYELLGLS